MDAVSQLSHLGMNSLNLLFYKYILCWKGEISLGNSASSLLALPLSHFQKKWKGFQFCSHDGVFLTHSYDKGYIILAILSSLGICCKTYTKVRSKFFAHLFFLPFFGLGFCILFFFSCNIWSAEGLIHPSSLLHACNSHPNTKHRPHESFQHCQRVWYS